MISMGFNDLVDKIKPKIQIQIQISFKLINKR